MKSVLRFFLMLALVSCAVAQTTPAPPEELALRGAYAKAATSVAQVVLDNALAKGPLPQDFNLNAAGVPMFVLSNVEIGIAANLPANLSTMVTSKVASSSYINVGSDGLADWQTASEADAPVLLSAIQPRNVIYTRYVHYTVGATLWGKTETYRALALLGSDFQGKSTIQVVDHIAPYVSHQKCEGGGCEGGGGENGGGTGEDYNTDIADSGDGYSIDLGFQPKLSSHGLSVADVTLQWIDPVLADPLFTNPNLQYGNCQQCVQDQENTCATNKNVAVGIACGAAIGVATVCAIATATTAGAAAAFCFTPTVSLTATCVATAIATHWTYNACMTNVKWACASQCK